MILPDNLNPLPVAAEGGPRRDETGFVNEAQVRQLLVGPLSVGRRAGRYDGSDDCFAGGVVGADSPFVSHAAPESHADQPAKPFGAAAAAVRRAPPPRPRSREIAVPAAAGRPWMASLAMLMLGVLAGGVIFTLRAPLPPAAADIPHAAEAPAQDAGPPEPPIVSAGSGLP